MISQTLIEELKMIVKNDYKKDLEIEEIRHMADNLVGYFDLLAKIYHQEELKNNYDNNKTTDK